MSHVLEFRNHPIIKDDGVLASFLTEPSFEEWRKHTAVSYEEESASKRVDRVEEMSIPSDLDDKLAYVSSSFNLGHLYFEVCASLRETMCGFDRRPLLPSELLSLGRHTGMHRAIAAAQG